MGSFTFERVGRPYGPAFATGGFLSCLQPVPAEASVAAIDSMLLRSVLSSVIRDLPYTKHRLASLVAVDIETEGRTTMTRTLLLSLFLAGAAWAQEKSKILIIDGQNNHDYKKMTPFMKEQLEKSGLFTVD